ncbi:MAG: glycosyltransferase family 4 protein [Candidatus Bipolaricaulota bacterium]
MNILLINHYAGSLLHGMEFRPFYLAREWVRRGHKVTIVAASHAHVRSIQPACGGSESHETIEGIEYRWLATPPYSGNGMARVRNMAAFVARLMRRAAKIAGDVKPDAVIASSTYPLDIFPARAMARRTGARLVFEVHDLWPLSPRILGGMPAWHPFIVAMQMAENLAYRRADRVVSLLPMAKAHMVRHGMDPKKFVYIPNGVAVEDWEGPAAQLPEEHERILRGLRDDGRFVVCYAGAHGLANALEYFVDAAPHLTGTGAHLVLVGSGPEKPALQERAWRMGSDRVTFLPPVSRPAIRALFSFADALYVGLRHCQLFEFGISPNKLLDYMMAGKPVLQSIKAGNDPVRDAGCGITVEPGHSVAIAEGLRRLMSLSSDERTAMGARGRAYAIQHHDYLVLARHFEEVLSGN